MPIPIALPFDKSILILAGFLALFFAYYAAGWFCDKNFRLVMRKQKLRGLKKALFHFRGSKAKEDRGHAMICVKFEQLSIVNLILGALGFAAVRFTDNTFVFLGCGALMAGSGLMLVYQLYINIMKYKERKQQLDSRDETGFEDYRASVSESEAPKETSYPTVRTPVMVDSSGRTDSLESGREILKNKGLLDDDIFSPFVTDAVNKYTGNKVSTEFSEESDIEKGKAILRDMPGKQLSTESYMNVNNFDDLNNAYTQKPADTPERSVKDIIDEHKDDINPENQFKFQNNYSPVRKDDSQ